MYQLRLYNGGHPLKNDDLMLGQQAWQQVATAFTSMLKNSVTQNFYLSNFTIALSPGSVTCPLTNGGFVYLGGIIYNIPNTTLSGPAPAGNLLYFVIKEYVIYPSVPAGTNAGPIPSGGTIFNSQNINANYGTAYQNQVRRDVHVNRIAQIGYYPSQAAANADSQTGVAYLIDSSNSVITVVPPLIDTINAAVTGSHSNGSGIPVIASPSIEGTTLQFQSIASGNTTFLTVQQGEDTFANEIVISVVTTDLVLTDGSNAMEGNLNLGANKIINLEDPNPLDVASGTPPAGGSLVPGGFLQEAVTVNYLRKNSIFGGTSPIIYSVSNGTHLVLNGDIGYSSDGHYVSGTTNYFQPYVRFIYYTIGNIMFVNFYVADSYTPDGTTTPIPGSGFRFYIQTGGGVQAYSFQAALPTLPNGFTAISQYSSIINTIKIAYNSAGPANGHLGDLSSSDSFGLFTLVPAGSGYNLVLSNTLLNAISVTNGTVLTSTLDTTAYNGTNGQNNGFWFAGQFTCLLQ